MNIFKYHWLFASIIIAAGLILLSHQRAPVVDALAAATTTTQTPTFAGKVMAGPDIMNGARLLEGETLQFLVTIGNPWSNNTVNLSFAPKLSGASLSPQSANSWLFIWTPPAGTSHSTTQQVTFNADFQQISGRNAGTSLVFSASLDIPLGPHAPPIFKPLSKQSIQVGQQLSFTISASSPESEQLSIIAPNLPAGATLSDAVKKGNIWSSIFTWTPTQGDLGEHGVTFNAIDTFTGHSNTAVKLVKIFVFPAVDNNASIKGIKITSANWNNKKSMLSTAGQILLNKKAQLPAGTMVELSSLTGASLGSNGPLIANVTKAGKWKITFPLTPTTVPCTLVAQVIINNILSNTPTTLAVTGAPHATCN